MLPVALGLLGLRSDVSCEGQPFSVKMIFLPPPFVRKKSMLVWTNDQAAAPVVDVWPKKGKM